VSICKKCAGIVKMSPIFVCQLVYKPASIFNKSTVRQRSCAQFTSETIRMPVTVHGLDDSTNNKLP